MAKIGLIGRLALQAKMITREQLRDATREQGRNPDKRLGEILVGMGYIDEAKLGQLLALQSRIETKGGGKRPNRRETPMPMKRPVPEGVALATIELKRVARPRAAVAQPPADEAPANTARPVPMALPGQAKPRQAEANVWLDNMLQDAARSGGSDVFVQPGKVARMRRFGRIHELTDGPISPAATEKLLADCFDAHAHEVFAREGQVTFAYETEFGGRYRVTVYHQLGGCAGVFHQVPSEPPSFEELGLPSAIAKLTTFPNGLLLVAGPVNGGKSATLAALVNLINEERGDHVITIEDTIETVQPSRVALLSQIEVGRHAATQVQALRNALREDPDVITIDPLVHPDAIQAAVAAADSGQLVIGAVPTLTAVRTIDFIIDAFPPSQRAQVCGWLASSLRAVLAQRLLPTTDEKSCVLALEVLYADEMVRKHIREDSTAKINAVLQAGRSRGSRMLDDSLARLVRSGHITVDVARANAHNPNNFRN